MKQINVKISLHQTVITILLVLVLIQVIKLNRNLEDSTAEVQPYMIDIEEPDTLNLDTLER